MKEVSDPREKVCVCVCARTQLARDGARVAADVKAALAGEESWDQGGQ